MFGLALLEIIGKIKIHLSNMTRKTLQELHVIVHPASHWLARGFKKKDTRGGGSRKSSKDLVKY